MKEWKTTQTWHDNIIQACPVTCTERVSSILASSPADPHKVNYLLPTMKISRNTWIVSNFTYYSYAKFTSRSERFCHNYLLINKTNIPVTQIQYTTLVNSELSPHLLVLLIVLTLHLQLCVTHGSHKMTHSACQLRCGGGWPQYTLFIDRWTEKTP